MREVVNTLMYQARTGCQWGMLPHDLLAKSTVWEYLVAWQKDGPLEKFPRLRKVYADNKYNNKALGRWMTRIGVAYEIEIKMKPGGTKGFEPIRIRRVVEQAHACHGRCRRLSKDYEWLTSSSESWVQLSAIQRMIRRLKPDPDRKQAVFEYAKKSKEAS